MYVCVYVYTHALVWVYAYVYMYVCVCPVGSVFLENPDLNSIVENDRTF